MNREDVVHIYNGILLGHENEQIWVSCNEVDKPRSSYIEWNKSQREKTNTIYWYIYMEWKMVLMNLVENGLVDTMGEGEGRAIWESNIDIYTVSCMYRLWEIAI